MLVDLAQFGPFCRLFLHLFGALKGLNGPKSGTMGQCISILYWYGAFGGQFGPFQSDFRPQSKKLGPIWSLFLYCLATEMTWRLLNLVQWDRGWHFCTGRGLWRPFWVAKWVKSGIQIGPSLFLWGLKSLWNGPKWSPKAPKGPTPVQYGNTLYHCTRFCAIQTLYWAQINEETGSKMAQTGPNPLACLGGRKSIGQLLALLFFTFSHLYIHRGSDLNKKIAW